MTSNKDDENRSGISPSADAGTGPSSSVSHVPTNPWRFDTAVTQVFEDMLNRSIPQYANMRSLVFDIGRRFVMPGGAVVDLGCSKGEALAPFVELFGVANRYLGVEISRPMLMAARARFAGHELAAQIDIREMDLRQEYPAIDATLTLSVLTLQFLPLARRQEILRQAYRNTRPGGALVLVEKVRGASVALDRMMVERYHAFKREQGYSEAAIEKKRQALSDVLVPLTARQNEDLLAAAGFRQIDCIWRWLNFAAWVAVKNAAQ